MLALTAILMCIFGLSACEDDGTSDNPSTIVGGETNCEHLWADWTEEQEATCKTTGLQSRICMLCEGREEKIIEKTTHKYNSENVCEYCGVELAYTSGLDYERLGYSSSSYYYEVKGIGTATETDIVIPAQHAGYPVKSIASKAFYGNDRITSIFAPSSITEVGTNAFYYCEKLHTITLEDVNKIGSQSFKKCSKLEKISIKSAEEIGSEAFSDCVKLKNIVLSEEKMVIGQNAFLNTGYYNASDNWESKALYIGKHLINVKEDYPNSSFTIKSDTLSVADFAFENVSAIETIQFPENEILIGSRAFTGCENWKEFEVRENIELTNGSLSETFLTKLIVPMKYAIDSVSDSTRNVNVGIPLTLKTLIITKSGYSYGPGELVQFDFSKFTELEHLEHPIENNYNYNGGYKLINAYAGMKKLKSLTIPGERKKIASGYGEIAFHIGEYFSTKAYEGSVSVSASLNYESYTFYFPATLKEVTIDGGYVRAGLFKGCDNFETISIKNLAKREDDNIGSDAFSRIKCKNLILDKSVNYIDCVGKYDYEIDQLADGVDNLFYNGTMEDWLSMKRGSLYSSLYIESVYIDGQKIEGKLIIPNGITEIPKNAFNGFDKVSSIEIPDDVTKIGIDAFYNTAFYNDESNWENGVLYCNKHLIESKEDDCGNTGIKEGTLVIADEAFKGSKNLSADLVLPNSVVTIGDRAFSSADLSKITIGEKVTYIGNEAFASSKITEIIYNAVDAKTAIAMGMYNLTDNIFGYRISDEVKITIGNKVKALPTGVFSNLNAKEIVFEKDSVCESIGDYSFYECTLLSNIEIPTSVVRIGNAAFKGCSCLTSIIIPNSVQTMGTSGFVFGSSVKERGNQLTVYCEAVQKPNGWCDSWNGRCSVVWDCKNNDVAEDGYIYTTIDGIIYGLKDGAASVVEQPKNIITAHIPTNVCYKNESYTVTNIQYGAFYDCVKLLSVSIPKTITSIEGDTFRFCRSLTSVEIPTSVKSIGTYAFYSCSALTNIVIPDSVTSIGEYAFSWCSTLANIVIPNSVTTMGRGVFYKSELITISCETITKPDGWNSDWNSSNRPVVWGYKG